MFFKCRNMGIKLFALVNKINNENVSVTRFNGVCKTVVMNKLVNKRSFCIANRGA